MLKYKYKDKRGLILMRKSIYGGAIAGVSSLVAASALVYKRQHDKKVQKARHDLTSHDIKPSKDFNLTAYNEMQQNRKRDHKNIHHITANVSSVNNALRKHYK